MSCGASGQNCSRMAASLRRFLSSSLITSRKSMSWSIMPSSTVMSALRVTRNRQECCGALLPNTEAA